MRNRSSVRSLRAGGRILRWQRSLARAYRLQKSARQVGGRNFSCIGFAVFGVALVACGPPEQHPMPGIATVDVAALPLSVPSLTLSTAVLHIDHIELIGDAGSPNGRPPPPPDPGMADLDLLGSGVLFTFDRLPQGVYSRVSVVFSNVRLDGTWRGTPLHAQLASFHGPPVDLRSAAGKELSSGQNISFTVTVDTGSWFAGDLLDGAMAVNGQLVLDDQHNATIAAQVAMRIGASFSLQ